MLQHLHGTCAHPIGLGGQQTRIKEVQSKCDEPGADLGEYQVHKA